MTAEARKKPQGSRQSRSKGYRAERQIVRHHVNTGIVAERVPLSGSVGGSFKDDLLVELEGRENLIRLEVKVRRTRTGFATFVDWLGDADALAVRVDREPPFFVVPERVRLELLKRGER